MQRDGGGMAVLGKRVGVNAGVDGGSIAGAVVVGARDGMGVAGSIAGAIAVGARDGVDRGSIDGAVVVGGRDGVDVAGSIAGAVVVGANVVGSNDGDVVGSNAGGVVADANAADVTSRSSLRFRVAIEDGLSEGACP